VILKIDFLEPTGIKWSKFAHNVDAGPNAYQKPENRGGLERTNDVVFSNDGKTMYVVDYGEVFTNFQMPTQFYTVPKSGVTGQSRIPARNRKRAKPNGWAVRLSPAASVVHGPRL
jgi:hypothetical protein